MNKLIGNKQFYKYVLLIAIPIIIQNGVTNFVGLIDNIMIGQIGTDQMSGVAIANQLIFIFNVTIFGAVSGASIFGTQYFGAGNYKGMRDTVRFKVLICTVLAVLTMFLFFHFDEQLISLYLHGNNSGGNIEATMMYGKKYLRIMILGFIPFGISNVYSSSLRETSETVIPMISSIVAVVTNTTLNFLLIFGLLGMPELGVEGAAIATVIARFIECFILIIWTHSHSTKNQFIVGVYKSFKMNTRLVKDILLKGTPLLANEFMWSLGMAMMLQCYSVRGLSVVAGMNISTTISNLFNVIFLSLGNVTAIIVGQKLGAGKMKEANDTAKKLIFFSVMICCVSGLIMAVTSPLFPQIYNTSNDIKYLASRFILVAALCMPMYAFEHATYFTIRSGGKTMITFLFDSAFIWIVSIPTAYVLTRFTELNIILVYLICQLVEILKCIVGYILVKKGIWLNKITY